MFNVNSPVETNVELEVRQTEASLYRVLTFNEHVLRCRSSGCFEKWRGSILQLGESRAQGQMDSSQREENPYRDGPIEADLYGSAVEVARRIEIIRWDRSVDGFHDRNRTENRGWRATFENEFPLHGKRNRLRISRLISRRRPRDRDERDSSDARLKRAIDRASKHRTGSLEFYDDSIKMNSHCLNYERLNYKAEQGTGRKEGRRDD